MTRRRTGWPLIVFGIFMILFFSRVFQEGMFFDGLVYSSLSNNLANGIGTFWFPQFSETYLISFHEHPPLAIGMEAVFMKIFDGAFYAEKIFSFFMAILTALFIGLIWRKLFRGKSLQNLYWLPILFWVITPKISWSYSNNMLENTMSLFSLVCVYSLLFVLEYTGLKKVVFLVLSGLLLLCAFLAKGFPGLFPLGLFFLYTICFKKNYSLKKFLKDSTLLFGVTMLIFFAFFFFNSSAAESISIYLKGQVYESIAGRDRVGSRLIFLKNLFNELIPFFVLSIILFLSYRKRMICLLKNQVRENKWALFFVLIGISASIPLLVSPKLSSFYLVCALPYFAIFFALFLSGTIEELIEKLRTSIVGIKVTQSIAVVSVLFAVGFTFMNSGTVGRDKELISDLNKISDVLAYNSIISVDQLFYTDWTLIAYFQRYHRFSIDTSGKRRTYHLIPKDGIVPQNYTVVDLELTKYDLLAISPEL